ncbi:2-oxoglutarate and iron-dependent oxygenase domain-containing protein [Nannocystis pusilla]|uniref:2-oxoglutarate and iron-dependent oxygenase domain-containing protein n=1 Tax=Nannocystis pusilla TaxID=889268 RepID=UPI003B7BA7B2
MSSVIPAEIPVIDIGPFGDGDAAGAAEVAAAFDRACRELGFVVVVGHGVPQDVIDAAHRSSRAFFDLDLAVRDRYAARPAASSATAASARRACPIRWTRRRCPTSRRRTPSAASTAATSPTSPRSSVACTCPTRPGRPRCPSSRPPGPSSTARWTASPGDSCACSRPRWRSRASSSTTRSIATSAACAPSITRTSRPRRSPASSAPAPTPTTAA